MPVTTRTLAVITSAALLLTGCARISTGAAERDPGYDPEAVNTALLNPGNYATTPQSPLGNADNPNRGRLIQGRLMAENMIFPFQIDPEMSNLAILYTRPISSPKSASLAMENKALEGPINDHNWVAGVSIAGSDKHKPVYTRYLQNVVLLFNTPADATAATAAMTDASASQEDPYNHTAYAVSQQSIPRYADTSARSWSVTGSSADNPTSYHISAYTAHGPYVLVQNAVDVRGLDAAAELVAKTLDQQIPLIDAYKPTFSDGLSALPRDPTGLLARMRFPNDKDAVVQQGAYGPHGALMFQTDQAWAQKLFTETGVDFFAYMDDQLTRARDNAGAKKLMDTYIGRLGVAGWKDVGGVPGLPAARCVQSSPGNPGDKAKTWCAVVHDNVMLEADSNQEADARQRLSADYLMLTAK